MKHAATSRLVWDSEHGERGLTQAQLLPRLQHRERERRLEPHAFPPEERADGALGRAVGEREGEDNLQSGGYALPCCTGVLGVLGPGHGVEEEGGDDVGDIHPGFCSFKSRKWS